MNTNAKRLCTLLAAASLWPAAAIADCSRSGAGYMYMYTTCVAGSLPCEGDRLGPPGTQVLVISNVFRDIGGNAEYPGSVFHDELSIQGLPSADVRESGCFGSTVEAEREQREHMARHARLYQKQRIFRIGMPDT